MKNQFKQIKNIIKEELALINNKITSTVLLETLKYKLIDRMKINNLNYVDEDIIDFKEEGLFEDEFHEIIFKLISFKLPFINLNYLANKKQLIISLKQDIKIDIENIKTKKIFHYKCIEMTGIIIPEGSKCSFKYPKTSVVLEIGSRDKLLNVDKLEESTI